MTTEDKQILIDAMRDLFMLMHSQREIAQLVARNQNAPKYLYQQIEDMEKRIIQDIAQA